MSGRLVIDAYFCLPEHWIIVTVAAIVVSYNRLELLRRCLAALRLQDGYADEIILVDNGSTDGSPAMVRREFPEVFVFETNENLGGAGGFAWGIEIAIDRGHDAGWLMDDDAEPLPQSLKPLVDAMNSASGQPRPAFTASLVVNAQGLPNEGHLPDVSADPARQLRAAELGGVAVDSASFVGVLIDLIRARKEPLPYMDFFIWLDDAEYTRRLTSDAVGVVIPGSRILHPEKGNQVDMEGRLFYYLRNSIWLTKLSSHGNGRIALARRALGMAYFALRQGIAARDKTLWARSTRRGLMDGLLTRPGVVMPGELIAQQRTPSS
jgi:rhamnopyranosyl-N-acetylglucosaminyl-diphospho-decaprenol beta-1,3/1,4-galactofuranosyltransferase